MMIDLTTTVAADAARIGVPTCVVAPTTSAHAEPVRERALAPIAVPSQGHVRLGDDATGFAGTPAWSPPT